MSDFFSQNLHNKVDNLMDKFYGAGVASHQTIIEQINYLLFLRELSKKDEEMKSIGIKDPDKIVFDGELSGYTWKNLLMLNPESLFVALDTIFSKISTSSSNKIVRLIYRNAHLKLFDKPTLRQVVHELDNFAGELDKLSQSGQKDVFGDMYEYLLGKLNQAGTQGQFRTPRHIIDMMVKVIEPKVGEKILDPAVGTAGFLVKVYEYLAHMHTSEDFLKTGSLALDKLTKDQKQFLYEHTFTGFDSDEDMIKFGMMNLYLHGLSQAKMIRQNTLADTGDLREKWDICLANPPFAGTLDRESVAVNLQMNTGSTEILFLRFMLDHLTSHGRMSSIVPEGVIFNSSNAHKKIRQMMLDQGLWAIVSLPSGIFNPYAGVKTSIVLVDKSLSQNVKDILFVKITNDGFSLNANRNPINGSQLPQVIDLLINYKHQLQSGKSENGKHDSNISFLVPKEKILTNTNFNLSGDSYRVATDYTNAKWPMVELGEVCDLESGSRQKGGAVENGVYSIGGEQISGENTIRFEKMKYITEEHFSEMRKGILTKGDVLMVKDGATTGKMGFWDYDYRAAVNEHVFIFRAKNRTLPKYLYNVLSSDSFQDELKPYIKGIIGGISLEIKQIKIPLPPLEIQKQIVAELDGYAGIIAGAKQIAQNWKPKIDIQLEWEKVKLGNICDVRDGTHDTPKQVQEGYPLVTSKNIKDGQLDFSNISYISEEDFKKVSQRSYVDVGDIIMPMIGTIGGACLITSKEMEFAIKNVALFKKSEKIIPKYLLSILDSDLIAKMFENQSAGATQKFVSLGVLRGLEIPLPPLDIQKQIVEKIEAERALVESAKKLIDIYEQKTKEKIEEVWGK